jgi:hypothetical protein
MVIPLNVRVTRYLVCIVSPNQDSDSAMFEVARLGEASVLRMLLEDVGPCGRQE